MDLRNSQSRPARPQQTAAQRPAAQPQTVNQSSYTPSSRPQPRKSRWLLPVVIVVLLLGVGVWYILNRPATPRSDRIQAVYVQTGQVYFGKLRNTDGRYLRLDNAYVAKAQDVPADATAEQKAAVSSNVSLTKVSNQVYGPEDTLQIRSDQVVFWQDLKTDSKVTKAINEAK